MTSTRNAERAFLGAALALFVASTAITIAWTTSMSSMGSMLMPGDWTMSMAWMRMPGQTWTRTTAAFVAMWTVMMVAMMLPSLLPALWRYRASIRAVRAGRRDVMTALVGGGYFFAWAVFGAAIYPFGLALAAIEMQQAAVARLVPVAAGVTVVAAGALQFTAWKARQLACCRGLDRPAPPVGLAGAWRHGIRIGLDCGPCCANLMIILLVLGVMDLRAMAMVTAAITAERLAPSARGAARAIGAIAVGAGVFLVIRAAGLG